MRKKKVFAFDYQMSLCICISKNDIHIALRSGIAYINGTRLEIGIIHQLKSVEDNIVNTYDVCEVHVTTDNICFLSDISIKYLPDYYQNDDCRIISFVSAAESLILTFKAYYERIGISCIIIDMDSSRSVFTPRFTVGIRNKLYFSSSAKLNTKLMQTLYNHIDDFLHEGNSIVLINSIDCTYSKNYCFLSNFFYILKYPFKMVIANNEHFFHTFDLSFHSRVLIQWPVFQHPVKKSEIQTTVQIHPSKYIRYSYLPPKSALPLGYIARLTSKLIIEDLKYNQSSLTSGKLYGIYISPNYCKNDIIYIDAIGTLYDDILEVLYQNDEFATKRLDTDLIIVDITNLSEPLEMRM